MNDRIRHRIVPLGVAAALCFASAPAQLSGEAIATGGEIVLLHDEPGHGGGAVAGGIYRIDTSNGAAVAGGLGLSPNLDSVQKGGYTGQLYDLVSLQLAASTGGVLAEGESARLSALLRLDDATFNAAPGAIWRIMSGPARLVEGNLLIAQSVFEDETALLEATASGAIGTLSLRIANQLHEAFPIGWESGDSSTPPYRIFFGTSRTRLGHAATRGVPHFNPGPLKAGTTYYYQIFDAQNRDVTPGGPGVKSFRTGFYRPDVAVGLRKQRRHQLGERRYNHNGRHQTIELELKKRRTSSAFFSVKNNGDRIDNKAVLGSRAKSRMRFVRYFQYSPRRKNVTASLVVGRLTLRGARPKSVHLFQIRAQAKKSAKAHQSLRVTARSRNDMRAMDRGRVNLRVIAGSPVAPPSQP